MPMLMTNWLQQMNDPESHTVELLGFRYLKGRKCKLWHLVLLAVMDHFLLLFLGREKPKASISLEGKVIAVSKVDHLGDVLMMTPFLKELRGQVPSARIVLVLGSWSQGLNKMLIKEGFCEEIVTYDPVGMNRGEYSVFKKIGRWISSMIRARKSLNDAGVSVFIDLRSYSPNSLLLARLSGIPDKVGYGLRGLSFMLQKELPYTEGKSLGQIYLDGLEVLGLKSAVYERPFLTLHDRQSMEMADPSGLEQVIILHPFSGDSRKMFDTSLWIATCKMAAERAAVVIIGAKKDLDFTDLVEALSAIPGVSFAVGRTSLEEAMRKISEASAFIGVDSFFSHVALACHKPTLVMARKGAAFREAFPERCPGFHYLEIDPEQAVGVIRETSEFLESAIP